MKMDVSEDDQMEGMKMEVEDSEESVDNNDCAARLSDETHPYLTISEGPSGSCKRIRVRSRPRLMSTKSFPPYSQCIGGLGEDGDVDNELSSDSNNDYRLFSRHNDMVREDSQGTERNQDSDLNGRCARDEVRAKWRTSRKQTFGGSYEADTNGWSRKRRVEGTERERDPDDREREGGAESEGKLRRSRNVSFEMEREEEDEEERKRFPVSAVGQGAEGEGSEGTPEELLPGREGSTPPRWSSHHPILSKFLQSSSSSSSTSSISLSSAESDEVFSDVEDAGSKRRAFRKCRSWKTYLTMMHWSLRRQSSWVQLAGHQGNLQLSEGGEVLKLHSEVEEKCLDCLMRDTLRPFVPQYHGLVTRGEHCYIRLEDLLNGLKRPFIMDCKMGVRTYQEDELMKARAKASLRSDMYQKMMKVDPSAPSAEEHAQKGVTKWRYLQWRDTTSSTATLGFRIEGIMTDDGNVQRDFRGIRTVTQVTEALLYFTRSQLDILKAYHSRLLALSDALKHSLFFRTHEVIGSSLLFVHDHSSKASVWMIDFGKTTPVSDTSGLQHNVSWAEGSREDGYLIGLTSLISSLSQAIGVASWKQEGGCGGEKTVA